MLARLDVAAASELPGVGEHLIDHVWTSVDVPTQPGQPPGPLTQVVVTMHSSRADQSGPPDLHLVPCSAMEVSTDDSPTGAMLFIGVSVLKPRSRGRLWLESADPEALARVDPAHLTHPDDMTRTVEGISAARELLRTAPLSDLVAGDELGPAPGVAAGDRAGLEAGIRATYGTYYHLGRHVPDGSGPRRRRRGRRAWRGPRRRGAVRRRRVDHARHPVGEHEPADDHDGERIAALLREA